MAGEVKYSFCESVWASSISRWHIRRVGDEGIHLGGGAPGPPLCGIMGDQWSGWDLDVKLAKYNVDNVACRECARIYREEHNE